MYQTLPLLDMVGAKRKAVKHFLGKSSVENWAGPPQRGGTGPCYGLRRGREYGLFYPPAIQPKGLVNTIRGRLLLHGRLFGVYMSGLGVQFTPRPTELDPSDEGQVFRDFESSRIVAIRDAIHADPWRYAPWYLAAVLVWTVAMSAGAAINGDGSLAVNLTPHIAHFALVLGVFFYPLRLIWVPGLAYLVVFFFQFWLPFGSAGQWADLPGMTPAHIGLLLVMSVASALLIGLMCRAGLILMRDRMRPHALDLWICAVAFGSMVVVTLLQFGGMLALANALPETIRGAWGFGPDYTVAALRRVARGGVVLSSFLLVAVEYPRRRQIAYSALLAAIFPALAVAQELGLVLHAGVDAVVVGIIVTLLTPVRVAFTACMVGLASYAALTGHFLNDRVQGDANQIVLENYATFGLVAITMIFALRSHSAHMLAEKDAAIRKLSRARDFAGVGFFAVNRDTRRFRLDDASCHVLGMPAEGNLQDFVDLFDEPAAFLSALGTRGERSTALTLTTRNKGGQQVVRLWLWTERTPNGARAAYGLIIDITEDEERETKLRAALSELSLREDRQRQIFSIISHELRTPASVLSMLIDDMPAGTDCPRTNQLREARDQLMTVLADMRQTVNPEQNLPVNRQPYRPAELGESIRNAMDLTARHADITVTLSLGAGAQLARLGDAVRVKQALTNLVRNAILHSGGTTVTLGFRSAPAGSDGTPVSEWRVEDDGSGIDPAEVDRLFEPFVRGQGDARRRADGSGLGLFIARSSIATLGGTLDHYVPATGGTGFVIRLPEPLTAAPYGDTPAPQKPQPQRNWTVVLAEDNALVAEITKLRLERIGGKVRVATNGHEALKLVSQEQPDIVITDLFMPELDGDDLARQLRTGGFDRPIIGLTAAVVGEDMDRFEQAGVNAVMTKPLEFDRLVRYLDEGFPEISEGPTDARPDGRPRQASSA